MSALDRELRRQQRVTANPNATPGAGRGSRNSGSPWGMQPPVGQRIAAGVQTPRLDSNPARNTGDAVAASNRSGAFGTKAANLQQRRDLYKEMAAAKPEDRAGFQGRAAALGVQAGGWAAALQRLSMGGAAAPSPTPAAAPAVAAKPAAPAPAANAPSPTQPPPKPSGIAAAAAPTQPVGTGGNPWSVAAPTPQPSWASAAGIQPQAPVASAPAPTPPPVAATPPAAPSQPAITAKYTPPTQPQSNPPRPDTRGRGNGAKRRQKAAAADPIATAEADMQNRIRNSPAAQAGRRVWDYMAGGYRG